MILTGWGRHPRIQARPHWLTAEAGLAEALARTGPVIPHGLGRAYGDSALGRDVVLTPRFRAVLDFDPTTGFLVAEAGLSLAEVIDAFLPQGFFPATTPGTKYVTLGGAVASDVHGKNHHQAGAFSQAVAWLDLMLPGGEVVRCDRTNHRDLFLATCGGMGLTGVILRVGLRLTRAPSAFIHEKVIVTRHLTETLAAFEAHAEAPFSVAWLDCLAREPLLGRAVLNLGWFAPGLGHERPSERKVTWPIDLPAFVLNRLTMALFNQVNHALARLGPAERVRHLDGFFYPLDAVLHWNRMYGRSGFTQYQFVLPRAAGFEGLRTILAKVAGSGLGAFLGVLKLLGPANENYLSFPLEGYTLALDFRLQPGLFALLEELDAVVLDHGGRLYLTKDVRMRPEALRRGYPGWEKFAQVRERYGLREKFASLQSERLEV